MIAETKVIYSVDKSIRDKTFHKELRYFIYDRKVIQTHAFDLVYWAGFEHMMTRVPNVFQIRVVRYVSGLCGTNYIRYKWKEAPNTGCPFFK